MSESNPRRIVFKCAFGGLDGWGHVIRCSALASVFQERGWMTSLWSEGDLSLLPKEVAKVFSDVAPDGAKHAEVLFVDEMYTEQAALEMLICDWRSRNPVGIVAGIDDMRTRSMHGFDLVVNTELGLENADYETPLALLGERYALLRAGFPIPADVPATSELENLVPVLVMIGGTDAFNYLPRVLYALRRIDGAEIAPIVIGSESEALLGALQAFPAWRVLSRLDSAEVAGWMQFCRFGIIGCGSSLYEAAAMELPFVGLSIVDNQSSTARKVESNWGMPVLFREDENSSALDLSGPIRELLNRKRDKYSDVDTFGAARVCDALEVLCR